MDKIFETPFAATPSLENAAVIDWEGILTKLVAGESVDDMPLPRDASSWARCPCGQLNQDIPRHVQGIPQDLDLAKLGAAFWFAWTKTDTPNYQECLGLVQQINARAKELLTPVLA